VATFSHLRKLAAGQCAQAQIRVRRTMFATMREHTDVSLKTAAGRALRDRCPCCGEGRLMRSYLKQVENCSVCGESFGAIRADDAAPWLTIILVGHLFLPLAFLVDLDWMPAWAAMLGLAAVFAGLSLAILPRAKMMFIAILWQTRAPGYEAA
jgi:uncharacterized protein (DUF983 family)